MQEKKDNKLGQNIQAKRKELGLTQEAFARKVKIPYTTLTKIEIGAIKDPSVYIIVKIAKFLNVLVENLVR
ncbi:MAG: helix-turn-helix transcriptional regulator [Candidatus Gracilibacteria bacterium]|nr:helix-turn-helix transcriptional regulator [Candidatus Gracilibacteria bacterium]